MNSLSHRNILARTSQKLAYLYHSARNKRQPNNVFLHFLHPFIHRKRFYDVPNERERFEITSFSFPFAILLTSYIVRTVHCAFLKGPHCIRSYNNIFVIVRFAKRQVNAPLQTSAIIVRGYILYYTLVHSKCRNWRESISRYVHTCVSLLFPLVSPSS